MDKHNRTQHDAGVMGRLIESTSMGNPCLHMIVTHVKGASAVYGITTEYDSFAMYVVGDYCWYGDARRIYLYKCTTAITTPESWNSAHWESVTVGDELSNIKWQERTSTNIGRRRQLVVAIFDFFKFPHLFSV